MFEMMYRKNVRVFQVVVIMTHREQSITFRRTDGSKPRKYGSNKLSFAKALYRLFELDKRGVISLQPTLAGYEYKRFRKRNRVVNMTVRFRDSDYGGDYLLVRRSNWEHNKYTDWPGDANIHKAVEHLINMVERGVVRITLEYGAFTVEPK